MADEDSGQFMGDTGTPTRPLDIVIEVPRGSFVKRDLDGTRRFVSPLPCPFNYGAVPDRLGLEGDLLDAVVLGPSLPFGTRVQLPAWGAVGLHERSLYDDKLICAEHSPSAAQRRAIVAFFQFYAACKGIRNALRGASGRYYCTRWSDANQALSRSSALPDDWRGPEVPF